jgi:cytochrome c-type biogenesis protein CcsB
MNKILNRVFSMQFVIVGLLLFAFFSAVATFIENDFGTETAKVVIYNSKLFEFIMLFLALALIFNIIKFKIYKREKLASFAFHSSFIVIILGAFITRYFGYEGVMHIREGSSSNTMLSSESYLQLSILDGDNELYYEEPVMLSKIGNNSFEYKVMFNSEPITISYKDFVLNAVEHFVEDREGEPILELIAAYSKDEDDGSAQNSASKKYVFKSGDESEIADINISFNQNQNTQTSNMTDFISIFQRADKFYIRASDKIYWTTMAQDSSGEFEPYTDNIFEKGRLYKFKNISFVPRELFHRAKKVIGVEAEPTDSSNSALIVDLEYKDSKEEVALFGKGMGSVGTKRVFKIDNLQFSLEWGAKKVELPFALKLIDFKLDRYAGSNSPSSYASDVELIDAPQDLVQKHKIYMNNVLDYKGYRFFQSSYDMDEKGTILSVNKDPGTFITYIGYTLLTIGLFLNIISKNSRFRTLLSRVSKLALLPIVLAFNSFDLKANDDIVKVIKSINLEHSSKFGELIVQDNTSRFKYLSIYNEEIVKKISGKKSLFGLNSNQIIVGMVTKPRVWQQIKMIKAKHPKLQEIFKLKSGEKHFAFKDAFDYTLEQPYLLNDYVVTASRKKPSQRDTFDKEILKVDERINVAYMVYTSTIFKIFPNKDEPNSGWSSPKDAIDIFDLETSNQIRDRLAHYFNSVNSAIESGDWSEADSVIEFFSDYQKEYGSSVLPSSTKLEAELLFHKLNLFYHLIFLYLLLGIVLFIVIFTRLIKRDFKLVVVNKGVLYLTIVGFAIHTFALGLRWYISGHAPWSNGYESVVYIAWAVILAGLIFAKRSSFALATTNILAAVTLFVANLSWLDPQITNLVPVLKSYWLTIHVSIITASYGFLGLSSLLGFLTMILYIIASDKNIDSIKESIKETTTINEMSMIIGLAMLTVGNFLGGVWANESWGRYWGWDPKETWALISILIYAAVLHQRFVPKLNNSYMFAVTSTVAFSSIIMTYFGVNFYLSGMHSYASGDPIPVPMFVYYTIITVVAIIAISYRKKDLVNTKL